MKRAGGREKIFGWVDLINVGDLIAIEISGFDGFARAWHLIGANDSEKGTAAKAFDAVAEFCIGTTFDDGCPCPVIELVGSLEEIAASQFAVPVEFHFAAGQLAEFGGWLNLEGLGTGCNAHHQHRAENEAW